jgi:hypothetical protein
LVGIPANLNGTIHKKVKEHGRHHIGRCSLGWG